MRGSHEVVVRNNRVRFKFTVRRNITILRGDSATGKTTLIGMIADYEQNGADSGVQLSCDRPCVVLSGRNWRSDLESFGEDSIVFVDEGSTFTSSVEFARVMRESGHYYVIATRESLFSLPYSVDEVYGIRNTGGGRAKYPAMTPTYSSFYRIYGESTPLPLSPDLVIVEDSNSGFEFFSALCRQSGIPCVSAHGRDNVHNAVRESRAENVLVIADGAAFGPEMERTLALRQGRRLSLFLPESFEWLVLSSGLVPDSDIPRILENPSEYVESHDYFSWERFFTALLVSRTQGTRLQYGKGSLNPAFLGERELSAIERQLPDLGI